MDNLGSINSGRVVLIFAGHLFDMSFPSVSGNEDNTEVTEASKGR